MPYRLPALALACLITSAARANSELPPARYDHVPVRGALFLTYPAAAVRRICEDAQAQACTIGKVVRAYAGMSVGRCVIVIADKTTLPRWLIRRHEYGHCNGWPPDHSR